VTAGSSTNLLRFGSVETPMPGTNACQVPHPTDRGPGRRGPRNTRCVRIASRRLDPGFPGRRHHRVGSDHRPAPPQELRPDRRHHDSIRPIGQKRHSSRHSPWTKTSLPKERAAGDANPAEVSLSPATTKPASGSNTCLPTAKQAGICLDQPRRLLLRGCWCGGVSLLRDRPAG